MAVQKQANYNTVIQTIGLRANPLPIQITQQTGNIKSIGFGNNFKGEHTYWEFDFEIEYVGGLTEDMLVEDFHLIPVITKLDETAVINISVFDTKDSRKRNIVFKCVENYI